MWRRGGRAHPMLLAKGRMGQLEALRTAMGEHGRRIQPLTGVRFDRSWQALTPPPAI